MTKLKWYLPEPALANRILDHAGNTLREWPECQELFIRFVQASPYHDLAFPSLACQAVGGKGEEAIPVSTAWHAFHLGVVLLDSVLDQDDISGKFNSYEEVAALSSGPMFSAHHFLEGLNDSAFRRASTELSMGFLNCAYGQYLDTVVNRGTMSGKDALKAYWKCTILKSGSVYRAGLASGAAVATDSRSVIDALGNYGVAFGVIKQILDDCHDIFNDLEQGAPKATLPVLLYSASINAPLPISVDRKILTNEFAKANIPATIGDIINEWQRRAMNSLKQLSSSSTKSELEELIMGLVMPMFQEEKNE